MRAGQGDQVNRESSEVRGEQEAEDKTEDPIRI